MDQLLQYNIRRSREGGNPSPDVKSSGWLRRWIPAFAGMTVKAGMTKGAIASITLLTLTACGSRIPLTPPEGQSLPPKPRAAQETPTPQELMEPSAQARPGRSDELLKQSKKREQDEFDLPPTN